jgi:cytochrome c oxidase subunit 3
MSQTLSHQAEAPSLGIDNRRLGIWALLGSEVVFFSALIVTYIAMHGRNVSGPLPRSTLDLRITSFNTVALVSSSVTMIIALREIGRGHTRALRGWLIATIVLGLTFLSGQAYEFSQLFSRGLSLSSNLFGATFFTLTGFHGAHVTAGVIWISFVLARAFRGGVTQSNHMALEMVSLYWHFVDLVWITIFSVVYLAGVLG